MCQVVEAICEGLQVHKIKKDVKLKALMQSLPPQESSTVSRHVWVAVGDLHLEDQKVTWRKLANAKSKETSPLKDDRNFRS